MILLPLLQDIEYTGDEKKSRRLGFYDYIYIISGNELLKFKIELVHMDVVNVLEKYIDVQKNSDNVILSEKEARENEFPLKFLRYLGKYRLENNLFKTKNYLAPKRTAFLDLIIEKYKDNILDAIDLDNLYYIMSDAIIFENHNKQELICELLKGASIEFVEKFEIDKEEITKTINNIRTLLKNSRESQEILSKLKWILEKSEVNKHFISKLDLREKFESAVELEKQKQKVK